MGCAGSRSSLPNSKTAMTSQGKNLTQLTLAFYIIWIKQAIRSLKRTKSKRLDSYTNNFSYSCKIN